jgi:hypothetical protein
MTATARYAALVFLTVGYVLVSGQSVGRESKLHGMVVDNSGAVVGQVHVIVHEDITGKTVPTRMRDRTITSDPPTGQFELPLAAGFYDVCVMWDSFTPTCQKVEVKNDQATMHRFRLDIDLPR